MNLTYLDTSNFILLSEVKKNNPQRFNDFITEWKKKDFILALSQIHLIELLQAKYKETRTHHLNLLSSFLPFRFESEIFFQREIALVLFKRGILSFQEQDTETAISLFSKKVETQNDLTLIFTASNLISRIGFYKTYSKANQFAWKAKSTGTFHNSPKTRFSEIEKTWFGKIGKYILAKFMGIDLKNPKNHKKSMEALLEDFHLRNQIKSSLKTLFQETDSSLIQRVIADIHLQDCKGLWLRTEVEKNLVKASDFDPNNEYDLDNIQYFPYVDIFVTDKRIVDKTIQVLRRPKIIEDLKGITYPKKSASSIDIFEKNLFS